MSITNPITVNLTLTMTGSMSGVIDATPPNVTSPSFDEGTDTASFTTTEAGTLHWATSLITQSPVPSGSGTWTGGTVLESGTAAVVQGLNNLSPEITATTGNPGDTRKLTYYIRDGAGNDSNLTSQLFVINASFEVSSKTNTTQSFTAAKALAISGNNAGDTVFAFASFNGESGTLSTADSGWSKIGELDNNGASIAAFIYTGAGAPSSVTIDATFSNNFAGGTLVAPGVSAMGTQVQSNGGANTSTTGLTTTVTVGSYMLHVVQHRNTNTITATSHTVTSEPSLPSDTGLWKFDGGQSTTCCTVIIVGPEASTTSDALVISHAFEDCEIMSAEIQL